MKKTYTTPTIVVEHYELTQSIAACATKIGMNDSACVFNDSDSTVQMKDMANGFFFREGFCDFAAIGTDEYDGVCYHTNANAAFTS